jgi:hypothetical protein
VGDSQQLRIHIGDGNAYADTGNSVITLGKIHHVVATWNGSSAQFYIDGVAKTTTAGGSVSLGNAVTTAAQIGAYSTSGNLFDGLIDDVSIFNTALSATEAQELFNDGVALDATTHSKADTNLVGYWRNDGVTTWQDRRGWSYLDFDGSGDFIQLPMAFSHTVHSISIWYNDDGGDRYIFDGRDSTNDGITLAVTAVTGTIWYAVRGSATNSVTSSTFTNPFNNWNHVFVTYDGSTAKVYVNGSEVGSGSFSDTISTTTNASIGKQAWTSGGYFNGGIASVGLYTVAKSAPEAQAIYNQGLTGSEATNSGILAYYKLDTGSTSSGAIKDLVGTNHGTLTGATLNSGNNGTVTGSPESIIVREGLNSNKDGLGFPFRFDDRDSFRGAGLEVINMGKYPVFDFEGDEPFTFMCWVKPNQLELMALCHKRDGSDGYIWQMHSDGTLEMATGNASGLIATRSTTAISAGEWTHIAMVRTGSNGKVLFYKNGALMSNAGTDDHTTMVPEPTVALTIGDHGGSRFWKGLIDEFMIYNKELSITEVSKNYKHGKGKHKN